jgi:hypothetical protein
MTTQGSPDPRDQMTQMWEAACRSLNDGLRQTQEFWNKAAQSLGDVTGAWIGQFNRSGQGLSGENMAIIRELQEASFAVAQAWMRLPMVLAGGAQPAELQEAMTRLTQAQGRAYQVWMDALTRARPGASRDTPSGP